MKQSQRLGIGLFVLTGMLSAVALARAAEEPADPVVRGEQERIAAVAKAVQAAVSVFSSDGNGGGAGVVISPDGFALSNFHVTTPVGDYLQCGMSDGRLYDAVVVGLDPTGDVAMIKLFGRDDFPCAELADSDQVRAGDWCFAVGNPFLLATDFQPTVTFGIVSGVHRYQYPAGTMLEYTDCIQTDAAINPGNSGGPLFNAAGQLIGVNGRGSFEKRGRVNVGVGYAISINQIENFLGHLHSGRIVDHATLGATVDNDETGRVIVSNILESSDAYRRGLRYGDEVIAFGGRPISSVNGFKSVLGIFPKGWRVPLSYRRDGLRHDVFVRLAGVHSRDELLAKAQSRPQLPEPPRRSPKDKDGDQPKQPDPQRAPHPHEKPPVPADIAKYIKSRTGYANYYFNEQCRARVWDALVANGDLSALRGPWALRGELATGGEVTITLADSQSTFVDPNGRATVAEGKDLSEQLEPAGSGGLLAALHLWRRLLVEGPEKYGEVYYLGTAPLIGRDGLFDVLVATRDVVETHFVVDQTSGHLVAVEMFSDAGVDPCEVSFNDFRQVAGRMMPHRIIVRHGDDVFAEIQIHQIELPENANEET